MHIFISNTYAYRDIVPVHTIPDLRIHVVVRSSINFAQLHVGNCTTDSYIQYI